MIGIVAIAGLALALQDSKPAPVPSTPIERTAAPPKAVTDTGVAATRAAVAPVIDGRDDDAVWREAPVA